MCECVLSVCTHAVVRVCACVYLCACQGEKEREESCKTEWREKGRETPCVRKEVSGQFGRQGWNGSLGGQLDATAIQHRAEVIL